MDKIVVDTPELGFAVIDEDDGTPDECLMCDEPDCRTCPDKRR